MGLGVIGISIEPVECKICVLCKLAKHKLAVAASKGHILNKTIEQKISNNIVQEIMKFQFFTNICRKYNTTQV